MTWTFQFIIIYIIYSQKLTKKLLQGATQVLDKVELILIQNLLKHIGCIGCAKVWLTCKTFTQQDISRVWDSMQRHDDKVIFRLLWCHAFLKMRVDIVWVLMVTFCSVVMFFYGRTFNLWLGQQAWRVWMTSLFVWINRLQIDWLFQHSN